MRYRRRPGWARRDPWWRRLGRGRGRTGSALLVGLSVVASGLLLQIAFATGVSTAVTDVPDSSADQVHPVLAGAPVITGVEEGDARLVLEVAAPGEAVPEAYEYSTDGGVSWRTRNDAAGVSTPVTLTVTSVDGGPLVNGTTYPVRLRSLGANGQGRVSNLVAATPQEPVPPPMDGVPVRWIPVEGDRKMQIDPGSSAIRFSAGGERRALVDMEPVARGALELTGTRFTRGNGWGVIVHGGTDDRGRFEGYTVQLDRAFGDRVIVRHWRGGSEYHRAIAVSDTQPVNDAPTDVRVEVDGAWLRVLVDGTEVLLVPDLPAAAEESGSSGATRTDGVFGLRAWSSTNLRVVEAELTVG